MKKIFLSENSFNAFKKCLIKEAVKPNPYLFGTEQKDFKKDCIDPLSTIKNLRVDKYKDYELEECYKEWENTGFDKSSMEYKTWCGKLKSYMDFLGTSINFVYYNKVKRVGDTRPHYVFLDPNWVKSLSGKEDYQNIYTLTLKIYQNKVIWNDLFFNPIFNDLKELLKGIRGFANKQKILNPNLSLLLPMEEYTEIGKAMKPENAKPELFYEPEGEINNEPQEDIKDIDWG